MTTKTIANSHGIRDNYGRGKVADFLAEKPLVALPCQHSPTFVLLKGAV
ncbi:MAG: hypothetical protein K8H75_18855 [Sulfuricella sp.]|nr:hypothetical protein [Sulfuricella sp.]